MISTMHFITSAEAPTTQVRTTAALLGRIIDGRIRIGSRRSRIDNRRSRINKTTMEFVAQNLGELCGRLLGHAHKHFVVVTNFVLFHHHQLIMAPKSLDPNGISRAVFHSTRCVRISIMDLRRPTRPTALLESSAGSIKVKFFRTAVPRGRRQREFEGSYLC